jgi:hypothetical protein
MALAPLAPAIGAMTNDKLQMTDFSGQRATGTGSASQFVICHLSFQNDV